MLALPKAAKRTPLAQNQKGLDQHLHLGTAESHIPGAPGLPEVPSELFSATVVCPPCSHLKVLPRDLSHTPAL